MTKRRPGHAYRILPILLVAGCRHSGNGGVDSGNQCPASWLEAPVVDPSIAVPSGSARVIFHAAAVGAQIYACKPADDDPSAPLAWSLRAPEARLVDCKGAVVGRHFLNEDAGLPEWKLKDGAFVVARRKASSPRTDAIAWLLLVAESAPASDAGAIASSPAQGAIGPFGETRYVHRVHTKGGLPPTGPCTRSASAEIPYTADYYFYGP